MKIKFYMIYGPTMSPYTGIKKAIFKIATKLFPEYPGFCFWVSDPDGGEICHISTPNATHWERTMEEIRSQNLRGIIPTVRVL